MSKPPIATRADFLWFTEMPTRWMDNDIYGHVNNVQYYSFIDTAVALFLLENGVLDLATSTEVGLVVETQCRYFAPITFPDRITCGVRCGRLGTSSIRYEIGLFRNDEDQASAEAHFVHVYVARAEQTRTVPLPAKLREAAMRKLLPSAP
ncbi:acyl-CoA thioesterase [Siccirubricoccus sp. KC 17139]|uniref:Acyl-CoA thioesterase n=1 Tax=Siccirubricoccus soli TaxID=2899147 RepID=A0ABT1D9P3_9PROT|nr:acyl-CoA thioesterase [Siccirubricoccus soli]MCO6417720.1 acyl-CoA thioesterase [Siccirubricoccus soli]MCP2683855.1 acyl-CoA thioesterase [Siccirubricoccus soli]